MTNLADAYDLIAEGFAAAALALREGATASPDAPGAAPAADAAPGFDELPPSEWDYEEPAAVTAVPHGSEAVCPRHGRPYKDGKYGPFCSSVSDDPKWSNDRGYCRITPKNAAAYLREKAKAAA